MPHITSYNKRDDYCNWYYCTDSNSNWTWARWILFLLFIVFLVFLFGLTRFVNRKRGRNGQAPIKGTSWMTPPSYYQSQRQYNQPINSTGPSDATYVPPYSESAQPYDAGYYDSQGVFHPNKALDNRAVIPDSTPNTNGVSKPSNAYHSPQAANFDNDFPAFYGGQQNNNINNNSLSNSNNNSNVNSNSYSPRSNRSEEGTELYNLRPAGPPPRSSSAADHVGTSGSSSAPSIPPQTHAKS